MRIMVMVAPVSTNAPSIVPIPLITTPRIKRFGSPGLSVSLTGSCTALTADLAPSGRLTRFPTPRVYELHLNHYSFCLFADHTRVKCALLFRT